jgi:hypothetical protein
MCLSVTVATRRTVRKPCVINVCNFIRRYCYVFWVTDRAKYHWSLFQLTESQVPKYAIFTASRCGNYLQKTAAAHGCSCWDSEAVCLSVTCQAECCVALRVPLTRDWLTDWLTAVSRVLPEKLTVPQPFKKSPAFYGTARFITALTRARHLSLSWARAIQSMSPSHSFKIILILSFHLHVVVRSGLLPWDLPTKLVYASLLSPIRATCPVYLIILDVLTRITFGDEYRS